VKAAVIAHYYYHPVWDDNFLSILSLVTRTVNRVIVVTTRIDMPDLPAALSQVELIRRPNIGYDFYSYRVGLTALFKNKDVHGVFLLNSSFILLNSKHFSTLLHAMCDDNRTSAIRGATASSQVTWHLQSYLLYFDIQKLPSHWLQDFFETVQPANTKSELILACEIELGRTIVKQKISAEAIFSPNFSSRWHGTLAWLRRRMPSAERFNVLKPKTWKSLGGINWTHFAALNLAEQFGIVKAEVLCVNPYGFNLKNIVSLCNKQLLPGMTRTLECIKTNHSSNKQSVTSSAFEYRLFESNPPRKQGAKIAVAVHLYYLDLLDEILTYLKHIQEPFDLYITTPFEADVFPIFKQLDAHGQASTIMLIENRGRDIAPFLALYRTGLLNAYDAALKLHSKKSAYDNRLGAFWRKQLYEALCGNALTVQNSLNLLRNTHVGMIGPEKYFIRHWGESKNKSMLTNILTTSGIKVPDNEPDLGFFAGTMFWFAPKAFDAITAIPDTAPVLCFEPEPTKQDGTAAHAWERAFCLFSREAGYTVTSLPLAGKDIFICDPMNKSIPRPPGFSMPKFRDLIRGSFRLTLRLLSKLRPPGQAGEA
jgi:lipopolysaccharide biosynthesis protein